MTSNTADEIKANSVVKYYYKSLSRGISYYCDKYRSLKYIFTIHRAMFYFVVKIKF